MINIDWVSAEIQRQEWVKIVGLFGEILLFNTRTHEIKEVENAEFAL